MVTKYTHHWTSSGQEAIFTSNFSFHGHLLTLHCQYSNYMKLWAGRPQEKLKLVSIKSPLVAILQPFCTLTRCWYCCFYGLSFDIALRLGQYNENGQFTKAASGYRTQNLTCKMFLVQIIGVGRGVAPGAGAPP